VLIVVRWSVIIEVFPARPCARRLATTALSLPADSEGFGASGGSCWLLKATRAIALEL
jgi:hypothetical protein